LEYLNRFPDPVKMQSEIESYMEDYDRRTEEVNTGVGLSG